MNLVHVLLAVGLVALGVDDAFNVGGDVLDGLAAVLGLVAGGLAVSRKDHADTHRF